MSMSDSACWSLVFNFLGRFGKFVVWFRKFGLRFGRTFQTFGFCSAQPSGIWFFIKMHLPGYVPIWRALNSLATLAFNRTCFYFHHSALSTQENFCVLSSGEQIWIMKKAGVIFLTSSQTKLYFSNFESRGLC